MSFCETGVALLSSLLVQWFKFSAGVKEKVSRQFLAGGEWWLLVASAVQLWEVLIVPKTVESDGFGL